MCYKGLFFIRVVKNKENIKISLPLSFLFKTSLHECVYPFCSGI
jgi:hypothetical protein